MSYLATDLAVYVMAGGKSERFGSDKLRATLMGRPLLLHATEAAARWSPQVFVVADRAGRYDDLGLTTIGDLMPDLGPVGGLRTALGHTSEPWVLITAGDLPGLRDEWIAALLGERARGAKAVALKAERWQPMPALFHSSAAPIVEQCLQHGERAMWRLLDALSAIAVPLPEGWPHPSGINTPEELAAFGQRMREQAT
jgi:molybdopterin-guanine dinucleotide biosynthesis protein A